MKEKLVFTLLMGITTIAIVSFTLLGVNRGFSPGFIWIWLKSWIIAYVAVIPVILILSPKVQRIAKYLCSIVSMAHKVIKLKQASVP